VLAWPRVSNADHNFDQAASPTTEIFGFFSRGAGVHLESRLGQIGQFGLSPPSTPAAIGRHNQIYQDKIYRDDAVLLKGPGATIKRDGGERPQCIQIAVATIYNRSELMSSLGLTAYAALSDTDLLAAAYRQWGKACPEHVIGDWSFAAWHPDTRTLFVARDHAGNTALYYYLDSDTFAFSTSRRSLLNLKLTPSKLDPLYLGQILIGWDASIAERSIHSAIRRLPPAHCLTVTADRSETRRYWQVENATERALGHREDYVAELREVFNCAVRERLPPDGTVAASLSGGLDSGAVAVTAADLLRARGRMLSAYTAVPRAETAPYVGSDAGNEWPLAASTAEASGNIALHRVDSAAFNPIQAIKAGLSICLEPLRSAANLYWLIDLYRTAGQDGHVRMLTGQAGNAGLSWPGAIFSQSLLYQLRSAGPRRSFGRIIKRFTPAPIASFIRPLRRKPDWTASAISPEFANTLWLFERRMDDAWEHGGVSPLHQRMASLIPSRSVGGFLHAELGAANGLLVTDPTADPRILAFVLSVPDHIFIDARTGTDRWLIREAMKGHLPDAVRLNRRRGLQAADLVPRLRACADEVRAALDEIANGPGSAYLDMRHMNQVWSRIEAEDNPEVYRLAASVLLRGLMAGLFVNGFGRTW
jgi:asparagine synthase (glutamine-hydrolysing)